jgi:hypothetical protein
MLCALTEGVNQSLIQELARDSDVMYPRAHFISATLANHTV